MLRPGHPVILNLHLPRLHPERGLHPNFSIQVTSTGTTYQGLIFGKVGLSPLPVRVTTRIITFLVGNPYKPSFPLLLGGGTTQMIRCFTILPILNCQSLWTQNVVQRFFDWRLEGNHLLQREILRFFTSIPSEHILKHDRKSV